MILDQIIASKKKRLIQLKEKTSLDDFKKIIHLDENRGLFDETPFDRALLRKDFAVIAEVKKASPSKGLICDNFHPSVIAQQYEAAGAAAVSVLTEEDYFLGSNQDLMTVKKDLKIPVLRKDFIIDPWQIYEAKAVGADAILLIAAVLDGVDLKRFHAIARILGMSALVEVHDEKELEKALDCGANIIGINNRNLHTFEVSLETTARLMPFVPSDRLVISESGIATHSDIEFLRSLGVRGVLIGETLMRATDIGQTMQALFGNRGSAACL